MLTLIDNYDSFTYNLVHFLGELGAPARIYRNDKITVNEVLAEAPEAIVLSPGPCDPDRGRNLPRAHRPGRTRGADPRRVPWPSGHRPSLWRPRRPRADADAWQAVKGASQRRGVFAGLPQDFSATRYHSLVVERASLPDDTRDHRGDRRRRDHGPAAQALSRAWRAVPSREHRLGARPSAPRQFPRSCPGGAARERAGPREAVGAL